MPDDRRIALALFVLAAVAFGWFFGGEGWNQNAQFDLTRAIVERHTLYIDGYDGNTKDISYGAGGHRYINKVPGVSFLAAVPYALLFRTNAAPRTKEWLCTAATSGVCGALIGVVLYLHGRRRYGAAPRDALAVSLAILFGTIVFAYSTMLFVHVPTALFLLLAVVLLDEHPLAAGAAAGMATLCFDVCAVAVLLLLLLAPSRRAAARLLAGGVPFAMILGLYQWACFGSPFRPPLAASPRFTQHGLLFGVLRLPSNEALFDITFSPFRGLFFVSPFLLFAFVGFRHLTRREGIGAGGIVAIFFIVIAGFNGWHGGWAFGPRYLLPIIPLLGIPMLAAAGAASRAARVVWIAAALVSVAINFLATAVDPMPPPTVRDPLFAYIVPAFVRGELPEETRFDLPWFRERNPQHVANAGESGNAGELLFGKGTRASVVPIALWLLGGSAALFAATRARAPSPRPSRPPRTP